MRRSRFGAPVLGQRLRVFVAAGDGFCGGQVTIREAFPINALGPWHEFAVGEGRHRAPRQLDADIDLHDFRSASRSRQYQVNRNRGK